MKEIAERSMTDNPKSDTKDSLKAETREESGMAIEVQPRPPEPLMKTWQVLTIVWAMWAITTDAGKPRGATEDTQGGTRDNNWTDRLCKVHRARSEGAYSGAEWEERSVIREINNFYKKERKKYKVIIEYK